MWVRRRLSLPVLLTVSLSSAIWTAGTGQADPADSVVSNPYRIGRGALPPADAPLWSLSDHSGRHGTPAFHAIDENANASAPAGSVNARLNACASSAAKLKRRCRTVLLRDPSAPRALQFSGPPEVSSLWICPWQRPRNRKAVRIIYTRLSPFPKENFLPLICY